MLHATQSTPPTTTALQMPGKIRALLLDDNNFDRARIRRLSEKTDLAIEMDEVDSIAELDRAVLKEHYDLILIDYRLPVGNGMVALDHVLKNDLNRDSGKIMITGDNARQTVIDAMRGGCHDFLTKEEMDADALRCAMLNALSAARARLQMELQGDRQRELIRQGLVAAMHDSEVQGNVISIMRQQMLSSDLNRFGILRQGTENSYDDMLAALGDDDEFIFH